MENADKPFFVHTMHEKYLEIAADAYIKYFNLDKQSKSINYNDGGDGKEALLKALNLVSQMQKHVTISIIFSALCLEAFINYYAINNLKRPYFNKYIESLPIGKKWMIVPKLINGKSFEMGSHEMAELKYLFDERDNLVHFKTMIYNTVEQFMKENPKGHSVKTMEKTKRALLAVGCVLDGLKKLDPEVDISWAKSALGTLSLRNK